jgi:hypothetical protein
MAKFRQDSPAGMQRGSEVSPPAAKNKPVHEIRIGRVKVVIWANDTEAGMKHNVTVQRIFKRDGSSQWEQSDSFGRDDLPLLQEVIHQAWLWIYANHA